MFIHTSKNTYQVLINYVGRNTEIGDRNICIIYHVYQFCDITLNYPFVSDEGMIYHEHLWLVESDLQQNAGILYLAFFFVYM